VSVIISDEAYRNITPFSARTPTFLATALYHPGSDHPQSVSYLFLLEHPDQSMGLLEAADALMVVIPAAV
jgi:hypothetical protein